jgi:hypothetical protein
MVLRKAELGIRKILVLGLALAGAALPASASLQGGAVQMTYAFGPVANPTLSADAATTVPGSLTSTHVNVAIAFAADGIELMPSNPGTLDLCCGAGYFNGFEFQFTGATPITGVTVVAGYTDASHPAPAVTFTADTVWVNLASSRLASNNPTMLAITTAAVPELPAGWMLLLGVPLVALAGRARRPDA